MIDVVDLGSSSLHETTNAVTAQCKGAEVQPGREPDYGDVPLMCGLGLAARPAPADENGAAQGVVVDNVPGFEAVCIGAFDARAADSYKRLGPGETAVFSTGAGFDSRILLKDQSASIIVGNDCTIVVDRKERKTSIACGGQLLELSRDGIRMAGGGAQIAMSGGTISLVGQVVLGGALPAGPVLGGTVAAPAVPTPIAGVFWGA